MESDERYRRAKRRVGVLKGFYIHLATYIGVMAVLFFIDFLTGGGWWFYWPLLGWGIGIIAHGFTVFGIGERKISGEMTSVLHEEFSEEKLLTIPKSLKSCRSQIGVAHRILNITMTKIALNYSRINPSVRQIVAGAMTQHMSMNGKRKSS